MRIRPNTLLATTILPTVLLLASFTSLVVPSPVHGQSIGNFRSIPPTLEEIVDPNVMINLSVETPMQGAAYNDHFDAADPSYCASGRPAKESGDAIGTCYESTKEFIGYFDSEKCYQYSSSNQRFEPVGGTNGAYECVGANDPYWSGNFLNWATMTAIDEFRWALTGGNRYTDTASETVLGRTNMGLSNGHNWFPVKKLSTSINVDPSTVTPYTDSTLYFTSYDYRLKVGTSTASSNRANNLYVRVLVCDDNAGLEDFCIQYPDGNYKPEGLMHTYSDRMRFAVMSYLNNPSTGPSHGRHGGVLRSNIKYVGPEQPKTGGGVETNPNAEWDINNGVFFVNPNPTDAANSGVANSGVINYINKFGANGYKSYDPIGELFYECINYFKNRGPTTDFTVGLTQEEKDDFPVVMNWEDPILFECQNNFIVGINDANPWEDKRLPGTPVTSQTYQGYNLRGSSNDWGNPSNSDPDYSVLDWTNLVGELQGINGTNRDVGCVPGDCDMNCNSKFVNQLGYAIGTCPYSPKQNSYFIAGLSHYANTQDIRSDIDGKQTIKTFMVDTQEYNATPLVGEMNMLWLTGKYGGFEEKNFVDTNSDGNDNEPDQAEEWDTDGDGNPDNYVLASRPEKLVDGLVNAFETIDKRLSAGSAAAVVANTASGIGQIVQALYQPIYSDTNPTTKVFQSVEWVGLMHSVFIDERSFLREDTNENDALDDYGTDYVVNIYYDVALARTRVERYNYDEPTDTLTLNDVVEMDELKTIWNSRDELAALDNDSVKTQRNYTSKIDATNTRYIIAGVDTSHDPGDNKTWGNISPSEVISFEESSINAGNYRFFRFGNENKVKKLVNFIRGHEDPSTGYRTRTIDYDTDGINEVWRQGDVVHSSPIVVVAPREGYDTVYGDNTYAEFREQYADRRQVVYFGGNDGMVHAINAGFWDSANSEFKLKLGSETEHPLGSELWAYIPGNLLPHLKFLSEPNYPHVYYVDGPARSFDANIFTPDATHPNGWGTILVIGMRMGGKRITIDADGDPGTGNGGKEIRTQSAYVILDITDPEQPPQLIAEITHPSLHFTTSQPTLVKKRVPAAGNDFVNPTTNEWYLAFGSGPNNSKLNTAEANPGQNGRVFLYDLVNRTFAAGFTNGKNVVDQKHRFIGNPRAVDWDTDYVDDAVYFGTIEGTVSAQTGDLQRLRLSDDTIHQLIDPGEPFVSRPSVVVDQHGSNWVHAGTGRLFVLSDNENVEQQRFFGIIEPKDSNGDLTWATLNLSDLQNVTNVQVFADGTVTDPDSVLPPLLPDPPGDTFDNLETHIRENTDGWYFDFDANGTDPSTRNVTEAVQVSSVLVFTDYTPFPDSCEPEGNSNLWALNYSTGTAAPFGALGTDPVTDVAFVKTDLGKGLSSSPIIHRGSKTGGSVTGITQQSTASVTGTTINLPPVPTGRQSWREIEF
ncbi:MAG: hypothetical protein QNI91_05700 [Arenicellales bacterium]|nr:hypothetical protein [Arenicellales bacterium]